MHRFLKTLLLWLLALALPVQGFAAAANAYCGPAAHQRVAVQAEGHHDHPMQAATNPTPHDESHASGKHLDTACCAGAVLLPSLVTWSAAQRRIAFAHAPAASPFSGHIPDGLKRPPKAFPA